MVARGGGGNEAGESEIQISAAGVGKRGGQPEGRGT